MIHVEVQCDTMAKPLPTKKALKNWASTALAEVQNDAEVTLRIVDEAEIQILNSQFRQKK